MNERQWAKVAAVIERERGRGRPGRDNRRFIEAVLWWRRTGVPWRDLPDEFGPWKTVFNRFDRWAKQGKWKRLFESLRSDVDDEWHSVDATINRAHQHAAGGKGGRNRTRSDARVAGHPPRFISWSMRSGIPSTSKSGPRCLLGDKGFDTNPFRDALTSVACVAVIPSQGNRVRPIPYDKELYRARSAVECAFNLLKQARRLATRYEKTLRNYAAVVALGCALVWLRL